MLYVCAKFREIISNGIKVMEQTQMINCRRTDRRMDGQTDNQKFVGYNIIPRHFLWHKNSDTFFIAFKMNVLSKFIYFQQTDLISHHNTYEIC